MGITHAKGEIELVGNVEDIVREQCPVGAVLAILVVDAALVADPVEGREVREHCRAEGAEGAIDRRLPDTRDDARRIVRRIESGEGAARNQAASREPAA